MPVEIRTALADLKSYRPSRRPPELLDSGVARAVNLAFNEGPYAPLPTVAEAIARAAAGANRYPDMMCAEALPAIANWLGVKQDCVSIGAGSFALFRHLAEVTVDNGDEVVFCAPTFEEYATVATIVGGRPVEVPLRDHAYDLDALSAAITPRTRMVVICNPNNPTGTVLGERELRAFLDRTPDNVFVVLDEAYGQFVTDPSVPDGLELAREYDNLAVLRTFSKAYGLAGIRIGFSVTAPAIAQALGKVITPFSVTSMAQAAAIAAVQPEAQRQVGRRIAEIIRERARIVAGLTELGLSFPQPEANFIYLPLGERSVHYGRVCEDNGVIVRTFPHGLRATVGAPEENDMLLDALSRAQPRVPTGVR